MQPIEKLRDRVQSGMPYEVAYGLEYVLMRRKVEGFNGNKWSKQSPPGQEPETIKCMVSIIKVVRRGNTWAKDIAPLVGRSVKNIARCLDALVTEGAIKPVDRHGHKGRLFAIDTHADEFLDAYDTQKNMFD